jgi:aryl-alcohol dehydrogenase-like predicted oxidoreductase
VIDAGPVGVGRTSQRKGCDVSVSDSGTFLIGGDVPVRRLGYGAMRITGPGIWGPPPDPEASIRVLRRAVELGVTFIDTAEAYGPYVSEELIRQALHDGSGYGEVVVATKGGNTRHGPGLWVPDGTPQFLRQGVVLSLRRLGLEQIPLWQLHRIDPAVPAADQFGALADFVAEGLVRHVGLSEVSVAQIKEAQAAGLTVATVQNLYNIGNRQSEDVLTYCEEQGIGFIPWFPIAAGDLARPGGPLDTVAKAHEGASTAQLALAWLLRRSPVILPIPGTNSVAHLEENLRAADLQLTDSEYGDLTAAAG